MRTFSQTLKHKIGIQERGTSQDGLGQPIEDWIEVASVFSDIRIGGGLEAIRAGAESSKIKASIRIRYRTGVTPAMRVVYGGTVYNILAVLPDLERRVHVDLVCEQVK